MHVVHADNRGEHICSGQHLRVINVRWEGNLPIPVTLAFQLFSLSAASCSIHYLVYSTDKHDFTVKYCMVVVHWSRAYFCSWSCMYLKNECINDLCVALFSTTFTQSGSALYREHLIFFFFCKYQLCNEDKEVIINVQICWTPQCLEAGLP